MKIETVKSKDYVAGWLDSSIHDFLDTFPRASATMKYALVTCLDSNLAPGAMLEGSPMLRPIASTARILESGLLLPTNLLLETNTRERLFFGFDEIWFFPNESINPKPASAWLVGPARLDQAKLDGLESWMSENACTMGLGDGEGLNFIVKAHGLVKHMLGHSMAQPGPSVTFVASHARDVG
ncbi:MAG: hypothetical protein K2R98_09575 [Gemmataceae bacterium]|nr:hypothetical protein [Gemmataceae bacterium]